MVKPLERHEKANAKMTKVRAKRTKIVFSHNLYQIHKKQRETMSLEEMK